MVVVTSACSQLARVSLIELVAGDPSPEYRTTSKLRDADSVGLRKKRTDDAEEVHGRTERIPAKIANGVVS